MVIPTIWTAQDRVTPTILRMERGMQGFALRAEVATARSERLFRKIASPLNDAQKQMLSMVGTGAMVAGTFAGASFSYSAITDYETAIQSFQAVAGASNESMVEFKKQINDVAKITRKSSIDVTKSFETIGGMMSEYLDDPKGLRQITEAGIILAKAARTELEPTLNDLTSVMNQFDLKAGNAADTINRLTAGEQVGAVRTAEVAQYLQSFGAVASGMNVSLSESVALIETLGIKMDKSKIGVGARNLLTTISGAGGLDKKAQKDLRQAGVDIKFLMDNTQSLSARLHELSKVANDPVKMISVFGKENVTAAKVIFSQLGTYDQWLDTINKTNAAESQAALNSKTLTNALDELKNTWVNMLTASDSTESSLNTARNAVIAVTNNLDTIVSVGSNVLKFFALWKGYLIASKVAIGGMNIAIGVKNALMLQSITAVEGNIIATKASIITERAQAAAIALSTGNLKAFNLALGMSPLGWAAIAIAGVTTGLYFLTKQQEAATEAIRQSVSDRINKSIQQQSEETKKLAESWKNVGYNTRTATIEALKYERYQATNELNKAKQAAASAEAALMQEYEANTWNPFYEMFGDSDKHKEYWRTKGNVSEANIKVRNSTSDMVGAYQSGIISKAELGALAAGLFGSKNLQTEAAQGIHSQPVQKQQPNIPITPEIAAAMQEIKNTMTVTIKNETNGTADVKLGDRTQSIKPNVTSTMSTNDLRAAF